MTNDTIRSRPFDIVVYGATGFTGEKVVKYIVEQHPEIKLAISGRNEQTLQTIASRVNLAPSAILVASLDYDDDDQQLEDVLRKATIVLACAGPFRHVGRALVRAAIAAGTDYLDICGEPQFFDDMLVEFEAAARAASVLVVSACAFDCVPAELSVAFVSRELQTQYPDSPVTCVELVHQFVGVSRFHATTFHAAVDGFHASINGALTKSRQRVKDTLSIPKPPPAPDHWPNIRMDAPTTTSFVPVYHEWTNTYLLRFMGADGAAIRNSQRYLRMRQNQSEQQPQPKLSVCLGVPTKVGAYTILGFGALFSFLARYSWGCRLLHRYPSLFTAGYFTNEGPTDEQLDRGSFETRSVAYGWTKDQCVVATCRGPELGYVATPKILTALALAVLNHRETLPFSGGVMLPGALFGRSQETFDLLQQEGISFEIVPQT
jgi:short subunit dehydrogenase-like uncharacterized protein